jgi:hypothetical protein
VHRHRIVGRVTDGARCYLATQEQRLLFNGKRHSAANGVDINIAIVIGPTCRTGDFDATARTDSKSTSPVTRTRFAPKAFDSCDRQSPPRRFTMSPVTTERDHRDDQNVRRQRCA